jgi:hypothetical protein
MPLGDNWPGSRTWEEETGVSVLVDVTEVTVSVAGDVKLGQLHSRIDPRLKHPELHWCFLIATSLQEVQRLTWSTCSKKEQLLLTMIYREQNILGDNVKGIHQEHNSFNEGLLEAIILLVFLHFDKLFLNMFSGV